MPDYRVSKAAEQDIRAIGRYTQRKWGETQRRRYLSHMNRTFQTLADSPLLAAERREFDPPVRIFRYARHLIVYRVEQASILILRVLHRRMDVAEQLVDP